MGIKKKRFNWKARENTKVVIDETSSKKIKIDFDVTTGKYDECNQLVLPSEKRPTKKKKEVVQNTRILSKKQRKKLEKVVEKKKKKLNRESLLQSLANVQAPGEELDKFTSITCLQTKGLKRHFMEIENNIFEDDLNGITSTQEMKLNSVAGSNRRKRILRAILSKTSGGEVNNDPNIVGLEDSDLSPDSSDEHSEIEEKTIKHNKTDVIDETVNESDVSTVEERPVVKQEKDVNEKREDTGVSCKKSDVKPKPAMFVSVERSPEIQEARLKLPILAEEQVVMEVISENDVIIIAGETGSGKTTQVPQFLYEAGYARDGKMIGITQPRRVAAISMAKRVAEEMNLTTDEVSYLIRFEGNTTPYTKIKYMTDGVLLKELQTDFILSKYSVIILDEAHERNVYTDILIGLLSRIVPLRKKKNLPFKLVIMSATLRVEDFTENTRLFKVPPPVVKIESRQYPVSVHFNRRTPDDYLKECFHKTCKIHNRLPEGGILIFVTGQQEVRSLVNKLKSTFPLPDDNISKKKKQGDKDGCTKGKKGRKVAKKNKSQMSMIDVDLNKYSVVPSDDTELDLLGDDDDNEDDVDSEDYEYPPDMMKTNQPLWVLPLYSLLPSSKQSQVFEKPPEGTRLCVVATNVAETSLTIPHIKYVVDSGKTKRKVYDKVTGVTSYEITWCSKASANQRAGRAGRVGPGHCYRLYSSAMFNDEFPQFSEPEIKEKPVDDLVLQMKSMNIIKVINFPFPTRPDILQLKTAERRLKILGALEDKPQNDEWSAKLTKLGETMASFPISPRYAKMLALSCQHDLMQYVVCIVAALSVQEVLLYNDGNQKWSRFHRNWAGHGNSLLLGDIMVLLRAVGAAEFSKENLEEFCARNGLRHKAIIEIRKLRVQLTNQINLNIPGFDLAIDPNMKPPTDTQAKLLRQIVLSGLADHVARKVSPEEVKDEEDKRKWKRAYRDSEMEEPIYLHSGSVLKKEMPEWVVYQEVYETNKMYMRGVTAIEPEWLPVYVPTMCNLSEPLSDPPPRYDPALGKACCHVNGTFGRAALTLLTMEIPYVESLDGYKWFAVYLLRGEVFPKLKKFSRNLLSSPSSLTKSWSKLQSRTDTLLKALISKEANSRDRLLKIWKDEPYCHRLYQVDGCKVVNGGLDQWVLKYGHSQAFTIQGGRKLNMLNFTIIQLGYYAISAFVRGVQGMVTGLSPRERHTDMAADIVNVNHRQ